MSDGIKHIHFLKVLDEDSTLKQTVFKYIQVDKNDVISKMADFIMTNHTIFSSLKDALSDSVTHFDAFRHQKSDFVRVPPFDHWGINEWLILRKCPATRV